MFYTSKSVDAQAACNCVADFLLEDLSLNKALDVSAGISDLPETCQVVREAGAQHRGILRNVPISLKGEFPSLAWNTDSRSYINRHSKAG